VLLQPDGRHLAAEEESVDLDLRQEERLEQQPVGGAAGEVVAGEDQEERQPVEQRALEPASDVAEREGEQAEQDPGEDPVARQRQPLGGDEPDRRRQPRQRRGVPKPAGYQRSGVTIRPAPTVSLVASSIRMKLPVSRLRS
jgi:hypothetical protein